MNELDNTQWKPKLWIAIVLGLFFQSLAMLYLHRVVWAIVYFFVSLAIVVTEIYLANVKNVDWLTYFSFNYLIMIIGAVHAYFIARNYQATENRVWYSKWFSLIGIYVLITLSFLPGRIFFYESFNLPANSMAPGYPAGSFVIIQKWGYGNYKLFGIQVWRSKLSNPVNRGDVIVFEYPENREISYIKRVVGLPGDVIQYKSKKLFINSQPAEYSNVNDSGEYTILTETIGEMSYEILLNWKSPARGFELVVPAENYLVLGDNRDNSRDSRYWGFVPETYVIGKVVHTISSEK